MLTFAIFDGEKAWNQVFSDKKGWKEVSKKGNAVFVYGNKRQKVGKENYFGKQYTKHFHRKHLLMDLLDGTSVIPESYTSYDDFIENTQPDKSLWFLKLSTYDCGGGVYPFKAERKGLDKIKNKLDKDDYVIQRGITDLLLYDGRKFDVRVHVIIDKQGNVYVCKDGVMRISWKKYSSCSCKKHQLTNGSLGVEAKMTNKYGNWSKLYVKVKSALRKIMKIMLKYRDPDGFALLGVDFIFDKNMNAWLLEINTYPNLYYEQDQQLQPYLNMMLEGLLDIVVKKKNNNLFEQIVM